MEKTNKEPENVKIYQSNTVAQAYRTREFCIEWLPICVFYLLNNRFTVLSVKEYMENSDLWDVPEILTSLVLSFSIWYFRWEKMLPYVLLLVL